MQPARDWRDTHCIRRVGIERLSCVSAHAYEQRHVVWSIFLEKILEGAVSVLCFLSFSICLLREFVLLLLALGSLYVPVGTFLPQRRADLPKGEPRRHVTKPCVDKIENVMPKREPSQRKQSNKTAMTNRRSKALSVECAISAFHAEVKLGPDFVCTCCHRIMYRKSVILSVQS